MHFTSAYDFSEEIEKNTTFRAKRTPYEMHLFDIQKNMKQKLCTITEKQTCT